MPSTKNQNNINWLQQNLSYQTKLNLMFRPCKRICRKTKRWSESRQMLNVEIWIQCCYKFKLKLKLKQKQRLLVETTVVVDVVAAHLLLFIHHHLKFKFQESQVHKDVQMENIWLMVHALMILSKMSCLLSAHLVSIVIYMEIVCQLQLLTQLHLL